MVDIPVLSQDDLQFLRELKRAHRTKNHSRQTLERNLSSGSSQNSYTVEVPAEGIPAIDGDTPGSATCYVVRFNRSTTTLQRTGQTLEVYNSSSSEIPEGYANVERDAFGTWWVIVGGSTVGIIRFTILSMDGAVATARVDAELCGSTFVETGTGTGTGTGDETVEVRDTVGQRFGGLGGNLIGRTGIAVNISNAGACQWEVIELEGCTFNQPSGTGTDNCFGLWDCIDPADLPTFELTGPVGSSIETFYAIVIRESGFNDWCVGKMVITTCEPESGTG